MYRCIRVAQFGSSSVLQVATVDASNLKPGPGQVLIMALAAGVNPVDTYIRSGQYGALSQLPYTPGSDCAGKVLAVGEGVAPERMKPGDQVYTVGTLSGAYAQLVLASQATTFRLPDGVGWAEGASLGVPAFTSLRALRTLGRGRAGETVLVHGASGAVGLLCCQIAASMGMRVLATASSPEGRQLALDSGAVQAFDHSAPGYTEAVAQASQATGGPHLIVEMLANCNLAADCQLAAPGGRVLVVGSRGSLDFNPRLLMAKEVSITGVFLRRAAEAELAGYAAEVESLLVSCKLRPTVGRRFPLAEAPAAHDFVIGKAASAGKIVLDIEEWKQG